MRKGQLSIEFIMMIVMSFAVLFSFVYVLMHVSAQKNEQKTFEEINNLGISLQNEFLLASELEDGYMREIYVPVTLNGLAYSIANGDVADAEGYLEITFGDLGITYNIPRLNGTIQKGTNTLQKKDGWLLLN
ncbi:MAG: hypothetical protein KC535_03230 [Nanoarchaeota archaeon]|nr:hypothetical protein [Nanoarchaeota archaeon]